MIVNRQPTEEEGQREKEQLEKNMGTDPASHQPGTSTVLSKMTSHCLYGLQRRLSFCTENNLSALGNIIKILLFVP